MQLTEEQRDQMQRAFEASSLYFNGETPTARVENWRVWVEAWKCALATHNAGAQPLTDEQILAMAQKYHYDEPDAAGYDFGALSLIEFARALIAKGE